MPYLAEFNIARLAHPLDAPENAEFAAALEPINAIAEASPGFIWRLTDESGASASYVELPGIEDPNIIVNFSIWVDIDALKHFVVKSGHGAYLRRRRDWFDTTSEPGTVCWWIGEDERPPASEGVERLAHMRTHGPSERGWPLSQPRPRPV